MTTGDHKDGASDESAGDPGSKAHESKQSTDAGTKNGTEKESAPDNEKSSDPITDVGEEAFLSAQNVYYNFYGPSNFGDRRGGRQSTGRVPDHEIDGALRWFVRPESFDLATQTITRENLLILTGHEGVGKRTAALALLRDRGAQAASGGYPEITSLSPASSLIALSELGFKKGHGYLIQDHIGEQADAAVQAYDAEQLGEILHKCEAYLVITTRAARMKGRDFPRFAVNLLAPAPADILARRFENEHIESNLCQRALEYVQGMQRPRDVLAVAEKICDGGEPGEAFDNAERVERSNVSEWFDGSPGKRDVLYITALAFLGRQPESLFEVRLEKLCELASSSDGSGSSQSGSSDSFSQRPREHPLITFNRPGDKTFSDGGRDLDLDYYDGLGWSSGKSVRFRSSRYREYVLAELHERYGYQLWEPVRQWLRELPTTDPGPHTQLQLAMSLASLAKFDFAEVFESFLNQWASGTATERATAAMALWFISDHADGELGPVALQTALGWGSNAGLNRAVTSAAALGGPLGLRFRPEAMRRLCFLALRAKRIGIIARLSIAFLFATTVDDGPESTFDVLSTVARHLHRAVMGGKIVPGDAGGGHEGMSDRDLYGDDDLYRHQEHEAKDTTRHRGELESQDGDGDREYFEFGWNIRVARAARTLVLAVLSARTSDKEPAVAKILKSQPQNVELLGILWAEVLCSAPHRELAIDALKEALRAVEREPDARNTVARLGVAIHVNMPAMHRPLRTADLLRAMNDERRGARPAQVLVSSLLNAVRGS